MTAVGSGHITIYIVLLHGSKYIFLPKKQEILATIYPIFFHAICTFDDICIHVFSKLLLNRIVLKWKTFTHAFSPDNLGNHQERAVAIWSIECVNQVWSWCDLYSIMLLVPHLTISYAIILLEFPKYYIVTLYTPKIRHLYNPPTN